MTNMNIFMDILRKEVVKEYANQNEHLQLFKRELVVTVWEVQEKQELMGYAKRVIDELTEDKILDMDFDNIPGLILQYLPKELESKLFSIYVKIKDRITKDFAKDFVKMMKRG